MTTTIEQPTQQAPLARLRERLGGSRDPGVRTVLLGIAVLWTILTILNPRFLTAANLGNLVLQVAAVATIAMGAVMVLLLGEIDLSLGSVSGFTAAVMGVLNVNLGYPAWLAITAAIVSGALVGILHGAIFTRFAVPSFVITLGGLLAWQGVHLAILGTHGNLNITDRGIIGITANYLPDGVGIVLAGATVLAVVLARWLRWRRRAALGLEQHGLVRTMLGALPAIAAVVGGTAVLLAGRGVPLVLVIVLSIAAVLHYFLKRRPVGRHIYAVGSSSEAAERAGINVTGIRILAFSLASTLAAVGGVLAASRLYAVNQSSGGSDLLLLAIASAVIGGVSLFGGIGTVWYALIGAVLVGSIANGMNLLSIPASVRFIVTGAVLVVAVVVDGAARKRAAMRG